MRADRLASGVEESGWVRLSAGDGAKGPRVYDGALVDIRPLREPGKGYWLLARRSVAKPEELAYYVCYGPAGTTLEELVRVAGTRWAIEECFEEAKGQSLPPRRRGWDWTNTRCAGGTAGTGTSPPCRGTGQALAMLAHAYLAVVRHQASSQRRLRVDSGRGQNRTLRLLSALWPPVFAGEQDVWAQELGLDCQPGVFPLSDRFAETGGIPAPIGFGNET